MTCNVGKTDRKIRIIAGVVIAGAGIYYQSWLGLIALVPLGTAISGWCPTYLPFKINTQKSDSV